MSDYFSMLCVNLKYVIDTSYFDEHIFAYGILEWPHTKSKEKLVNPWWRSRQLLLLLPLRGVEPGGAGGAHPDFSRSVNPISTRGNRLCPPNYYWHIRIFRPSDGPEHNLTFILDSRVCRIYDATFEMFCPHCDSDSLLYLCSKSKMQSSGLKEVAIATIKISFFSSSSFS